MPRVLIHAESRSVCGQLEQHAARLTEIDGVEPKAVDHLGRVRAGLLDLCAHLELMFVIVHAPREVMHAADAPGAARRARSLAHIQNARSVLEAEANPFAVS